MPPAISIESTVGETMRLYPGTTAVFLRRRMHCPGCHMAAFMTIAQAAASYSLSAEDLRRDLQEAASAESVGRPLVS